MPLASYRDIGQAALAGQLTFNSYRKAPSVATTANHWFDFSTAGGIPNPNYYIGGELAATTLTGSKGMFHGFDRAPAKTYLRGWDILGNSANLVGRYILADYLLFYPFIDGDSADTQVMINTETLLRYTDGKDVRAMLINAQPNITSGTFTYTYINQNDEVRVSPVQTTNATVTSLGGIATGEQGFSGRGSPFLDLLGSDEGIKSIVDFTFSTPPGGIYTLVLVKPLATHAIYEANNVSQKAYPRDDVMEEVKGDAFLGIIGSTAGSISGTQLSGSLKFIWD